MRSVLVRGTAITLAPPCISSFHAVSWWLGLPERQMNKILYSVALTYLADRRGGKREAQ